MKIALIYCTFSDLTSAHHICDELLNQKIIACANLNEEKSMYNWQNKRYNEQEVVAIIKTSIAKCNEAKANIKLNHNYDLPCILSWEVDCNDEYGIWVEEMTKQKGDQ